MYCKEEQIEVTGVGRYNPIGAAHWVAPLEFGARWDTAESNVEIGVIRETPIDGRHGFPFHEACWSLLEKALCPKPVPQQHLYEVCCSLPFSRRLGCLTWGHYFGGLVSADDNHYIWDDLYVARQLTFAKMDPYVVPEIPSLCCEAPLSLDISTVALKIPDMFTQLPLEIIILISQHLPTGDYLNARLASPSFHPVFYVQRFWASKFLPGGDRSWVFETWDWESPCDWRWLYRRTANVSSGMRNRKRVWRLAEDLKRILLLQWREPIQNFVADDASNNWLEAAGDLLPATMRRQYHGFNRGCLQFHEKRVHIPPDQLSQLAFSLIRSGAITFITGIRFISIEGGDIQLGYISDEEHVLNMTSLKGFNLAVGSRGIQGIQCIIDDDRQTQWIGCPDEAPKTKHVRFGGPVTDIKAGFDVSSYLLY